MLYGSLVLHKFILNKEDDRVKQYDDVLHCVFTILYIGIRLSIVQHRLIQIYPSYTTKQITQHQLPQHQTTPYTLCKTNQLICVIVDGDLTCQAAWIYNIYWTIKHYIYMDIYNVDAVSLCYTTNYIMDYVTALE